MCPFQVQEGIGGAELPSENSQLLTFIVAVIIITAVSSFVIVLILKHSGDKLEKPLGTLSGLFGTVIGTIGGYYFSNKNVSFLKNELGREKGDRQVVQDNVNKDFRDLYDDYLEIRSLLEEANKKLEERPALGGP